MNDYIHVLIVDDDPELRSALRKYVEHTGWRVAEADSVEQATRFLSQHPVDMVIADYSMPGQNGLELFQRMRVQYPHIVRVLLTGHTDLHLALHALNRGLADRFLTKPWDELCLLTILRDSMTHRRHNAANGPR